MFNRRFAVRGIAAAASLTLIATARAGMDDCPPPTRVVLEGVATPVLNRIAAPQRLLLDGRTIVASPSPLIFPAATPDVAASPYPINIGLRETNTQEHFTRDWLKAAATIESVDMRHVLILPGQ